MGSFLSYATFSRIKEKCEMVYAKTYCIEFENENGAIAKGCLANSIPCVFIVLKKSNKSIKDFTFQTVYKGVNDIDSAGFLLGYKTIYKNPNDFPETFKTTTSKKNAVYLKSHKRTKCLFMYKGDNPDFTLIEKLQKLFINGAPSPRTLNFFTEYSNILQN